MRRVLVAICVVCISSVAFAGVQQESAGPQKPDLQKPGMQKPGMQKPGMQKPGMQKPGLQKPGMQKPGLGAGSKKPVRPLQKPSQKPGHLQKPTQKPAQRRGQLQKPRLAEQDPAAGQKSTKPQANGGDVPSTKPSQKPVDMTDEAPAPPLSQIYADPELNLEMHDPELDFAASN
jgi:pentapeptide MXKDX repeat protein